MVSNPVNSFLNFLLGALGIIGRFFGEFWWLIVPLALIPIYKELRAAYEKKKKSDALEWVNLVILPSRDIFKTPRAMEEIFSAVHAAPAKEPVPDWFSFELVGYGGQMYFYVRVLKKYADYIKALFYSQYPTSNIEVIKDYFDSWPPIVPNNNYDFWGAEYVLKNDSAYPLITYPDFEDPKEEKRLDPLSSVAEMMGKLKEKELLTLQIIIKSSDDKWKEGGLKIINKAMGRPEATKPLGFVAGLMEFFENLFLGAFRAPTWSEEKKGEPKNIQLSAVEREVADKIGEKIAKLGFNGGIRACYIAPKEIFSKNTKFVVESYLKQFSTQNLNSFDTNKEINISLKGLFHSDGFSLKDRSWFAERRNLMRKRNLMQNGKKRSMLKKGSVFDVEELATMFHMPINAVQAPSMGRLVSNTGKPPINLPIISD